MATIKKPRTKSKSSKVVKKSKPAKTRAKRKTSKYSAKSPKALRLTFSYDGDDVKLVSQQPVEMIVPSSDPVKGFEKQKGFWAELKNPDDKTLFRRVMHNPTRNDAEVFPGGADQSITREPAPKRKGVFVVVVPATDAADAVTLSRSAPPAKGTTRGIRSLATKPATEIMRFKLKK